MSLKSNSNKENKKNVLKHIKTLWIKNKNLSKYKIK